MIQPAPGVVIEHEWPRWLPSGMLFPVARIPLRGGSAENYAALGASALDAARNLACADASVIAFACALGSLYAGVSAERSLIAELAATSTKPAISLAASCVEALRYVGATRLAILTPYSAAANEWVRAYAQAQGFGVEGFIATPMGIATVGDVDPPDVAALALDGLAALPAADALWLPCTAVQTMEAIESIEARSGKPAISGTQALLWHALRILGVDDPIVGAGRLFG